MTKKEYLTKMVEECLDVEVQNYDGSINPVQLTVSSNTKEFTAFILVTTHYGLTLNFWAHDGEFDPEDAQKLKDWMTKHGAKVQNTFNSKKRITFRCKDYPWQCWTEPEVKVKEKEMFKPGTKVRFTQKAKDLINDSVYWHYANQSFIKESLDKTFTVADCQPSRSPDSDFDWPSYTLRESKIEGLFYADYLLEEVPEEKEQPKPKPEVAEIIRLKEENRELKAKIQELEAKLESKEPEPDHEEQGKVHIFGVPFGIGFGFSFGW